MHIPETQAVTAKGISVNFVAYGDPNEQPPILLLHGISVPPEMWGKYPVELAKLGHYVLAVGRPEGRYAPVLPTLDGYARLLRPLLHELAGSEGRYDLVGLSWGGLLAQAVALEDQSSVGHLVVAGTPLLAPIPPGMPDIRALSAVASSHRSPDTIARMYGGDFRSNLDQQAEFLELIEREIDDIEHARQMYAALFSGHLVVRRMLDHMAGRDTPTMVMAGTDDPIVPFGALQLAARVMGTTIVPMKNGGHGFMFTRPEECARITHAFISGELDESISRAS